MKNKKHLSYSTKRSINGFIFALPFIIGFIMFFAIPLFNTIYYSFNNVGVGDKGGMTFEWTGIANYINLFKTEITTNSQTMLQLFSDQNVSILSSIPLITVFSLFMALLANQKFKGRAMVRLLFFLPIILGVEVVVEMMSMTTGSDLTQVGGGLFSETMAFRLLRIYTNIPRDIIINIINFVENIFELISQAGVQTLIYLTALQSISPSLYEVAKIEGATAYETFWKVTIPSIMHITMFVLIYTSVVLFLESPIAQEVYSFAFEQNKIGVGSALSVVYIFNVIVVLALLMLIMRKAVKNNEK